FHGHVEAELHPLERAAEAPAGPHRRRFGRHVLAEEPYGPGHRPQQPAAAVEGGGLSSAVRPDQPGDVTEAGVEADVADGDVPAVGDSQALGLQPRGGAPEDHLRRCRRHGAITTWSAAGRAWSRRWSTGESARRHTEACEARVTSVRSSARLAMTRTATIVRAPNVNICSSAP